MATDPRGPGETRTGAGTGLAGRTGRRVSTETKAAPKTTEFIAYVAVLAALLIAALVTDDDGDGGFGASQVWLYVTILTFGYMVARGLAKSGSREPYDDDGDR